MFIIGGPPHVELPVDGGLGLTAVAKRHNRNWTKTNEPIKMFVVLKTPSLSRTIALPKIKTILASIYSTCPASYRATNPTEGPPSHQEP